MSIPDRYWGPAAFVTPQDCTDAGAVEADVNAHALTEITGLSPFSLPIQPVACLLWLLSKCWGYGLTQPYYISGDNRHFPPGFTWELTSRRTQETVLDVTVQNSDYERAYCELYQDSGLVWHLRPTTDYDQYTIFGFDFSFFSDVGTLRFYEVLYAYAGAQPSYVSRLDYFRDGTPILEFEKSCTWRKGWKTSENYEDFNFTNSIQSWLDIPFVGALPSGSYGNGSGMIQSCFSIGSLDGLEYGDQSHPISSAPVSVSTRTVSGDLNDFLGHPFWMAGSDSNPTFDSGIPGYENQIFMDGIETGDGVYSKISCFSGRVFETGSAEERTPGCYRNIYFRWLNDGDYPVYLEVGGGDYSVGGGGGYATLAFLGVNVIFVALGSAYLSWQSGMVALHGSVMNVFVFFSSPNTALSNGYRRHLRFKVVFADFHEEEWSLGDYDFTGDWWVWAEHADNDFTYAATVGLNETIIDVDKPAEQHGGSYAVSAWGRHGKAHIEGGSVRVSVANEPIPMTWSGVDTGLENVSRTCLAWDDRRADARLYLCAVEGDSDVTLRWTRDEGRTWSDAMLLGTGDQAAFVILPDARRYAYWRDDDGALQYALLDGLDAVITTGATTITHADADAISADSYVGGAGEVRVGLLYRHGGEVFYVTSVDGISFS